jgi:hypothetical protein
MPVAETANLRLVIARRVGANPHGLLCRTLTATARTTAKQKSPSAKPDKNTVSIEPPYRLHFPREIQVNYHEEGPSTAKLWAWFSAADHSTNR